MKDKIIFLLIVVVVILGYLYVTSTSSTETTPVDTEPVLEDAEGEAVTEDEGTESSEPAPAQATEPVSKTQYTPAPSVPSKVTNGITLLAPTDGTVWEIGEKEKISWYDRIPRTPHKDSLFIVTLKYVEDASAEPFIIE